jgi:DNA-3-methyladenine glycosylase II
MQHLLHLGKDRRLKQLIDRHTEPLSLTRQKDIVFYLCASIMSQQLSTKVANTIRQRFLDLFGGQAPAAEEILAVSPAALRSIGLSNAKVGYVLNVARFAVEQGLDQRKLNKMDGAPIGHTLACTFGVGRIIAPSLQRKRSRFPIGR